MAEPSAVDALVPPWLESLLTTGFFSTCRAHADAARSECNLFCVDCPRAAALCFYCRASRHEGHRIIQIRRSSYHDVVRVSEVHRLLDVAGVQTYVINSARVVFLNERPPPRSSASSSSAAAAAAAAAAASSSSAAHRASVAGSIPGGPHLCEICHRTLLDPFRFCSLGCKLEGIRRHGDACFVPEEGDPDDTGTDEGAAARRNSAVTVVGEDRTRWRRRRRPGAAAAIAAATAAAAAAAAAAELGRQQQPTSSSSSGATTATTATGTPPGHGSRRRKGVPHRSPLTS